jgi:hypothetical protein
VAKKKPQHRNPATAEYTQSTGGRDWIRIVAVLLLIAGVLSILDGISAFANGANFNEEKLLFADVHTWGIIYLILGFFQIVAAHLVNIRHTSGMLMGITFASISGIAHFMSIGAYPIWSVIVMAINFGVLFVLLTESDEFA